MFKASSLSTKILFAFNFIGCWRRLSDLAIGFNHESRIINIQTPQFTFTHVSNTTFIVISVSFAQGFANVQQPAFLFPLLRPASLRPVKSGKARQEAVRFDENKLTIHRRWMDIFEVCVNNALRSEVWRYFFPPECLCGTEQCTKC